MQQAGSPFNETETSMRAAATNALRRREIPVGATPSPLENPRASDAYASGSLSGSCVGKQVLRRKEAAEVAGVGSTVVVTVSDWDAHADAVSTMRSAQGTYLPAHHVLLSPPPQAYLVLLVPGASHRVPRPRHRVDSVGWAIAIWRIECVSGACRSSRNLNTRSKKRPLATKLTSLR